MSLTTVRALTMSSCVLAIAGMIIGSIAGSTGWPITFGIIAAVAVLCLLVATSVTSESRSTDESASRGRARFDQAGVPVDQEALGHDLERAIAELHMAGADEESLRELVGRAIRLGRLIGGDGRR